MYCDDKVYPDLGKSVHHGEGVLHPVGEENVPDVALLGLARALVVIHHAGVVVHVAVPGHNIISHLHIQCLIIVLQSAPEEAGCLLARHVCVGVETWHHHDRGTLHPGERLVSHAPGNIPCKCGSSNCNVLF